MFNFTREDTSGLAKWWRNIDKQILFIFIFLFLLGLFFSFSSTSQLIGEKLNKQTYFLFVATTSRPGSKFVYVYVYVYVYYVYVFVYVYV